MKVPADLFARSPRVCRGLEELTYPFHDQAIIFDDGRTATFDRPNANGNAGGR